MTNNKLVITPKTKVFDLIEAYPELQDNIFGIAPSIAKLDNPSLRKTIMQVTTLQMVAATAPVAIDKLISELREKVGQNSLIENEAVGQSLNFSAPDWFSTEKITGELDVRPILASGDHPVHQVMGELSALAPGNIFKMVAPFLPVPLIEKATSLNCKHWIEKISETEFNIYYTK